MGNIREPLKGLTIRPGRDVSQVTLLWCYIFKSPVGGAYEDRLGTCPQGMSASSWRASRIMIVVAGESVA